MSIIKIRSKNLFYPNHKNMCDLPRFINVASFNHATLYVDKLMIVLTTIILNFLCY